jgi:hypothetical protein
MDLDSPAELPIPLPFFFSRTPGLAIPYFAVRCTCHPSCHLCMQGFAKTAYDLHEFEQISNEEGQTCIQCGETHQHKHIVGDAERIYINFQDLVSDMDEKNSNIEQ